mgnify:FL=1
MIMMRRILAPAVLLATAAIGVGCGSPQRGDAPAAPTTTADGVPIVRLSAAPAEPLSFTGTLPEAGLEPSEICAGHYHRVAQLVVETSQPLSLAIKAAGERDLTMIITGDGLPRCNDDFEGLNPGLIGTLRPGRHVVYVGTYGDYSGWGEGDTDYTITVGAPSAEDLALSGQGMDPGGHWGHDHWHHGVWDAETTQTPVNVEGEPALGVHTLGAAGTWSSELRVVAVDEAQVNATAVYCAGFVAAAQPTAVLDLSALREGEVEVKVEAQGDAVLLIVDDSGTVHCNDDTYGLNPAIVVEAAQVNTLYVYAGSYSPAPEAAPLQGTMTAVHTAAGAAVEPIALARRAGADPNRLTVKTGGRRHMGQLQPGCVGHARSTTTPDVILDYRPSAGSALRIAAESPADTTLAVQTPDGRWLCNDDTHGVNPQVTDAEPQRGAYRVWIGRYSTGPAVAARVTIDEGAAAVRGPNTQVHDLASATGPQTWDVRAGGATDAGTMHSACFGFVDPAAPAAVITNQQDHVYRMLTVRAEATVDTTLVVRTPSGEYLCDDDTTGLNPAVMTGMWGQGEYLIWVGTFHAADRGAPARLFVETSEEPNWDDMHGMYPDANHDRY